MTGLLLLKEVKGISDEEVCATWRENPYFQYGCGEEYFQPCLPVEPPSFSVFRTRSKK
jgi:IS5 family transposase